MKIKTTIDREFEVAELDDDNEVQFNVEGAGDYVTAWLNIQEIKELIKFLQNQVDEYNLKPW